MRIVIALGGNALGIEPEVQYQNALKTAKYLVPIINAGHEVIITHGNGPQVGLINLAFEEGVKHNPKVYEMPFAECGAMSQGYIGYHLANTISNELKENGLEANVINVLTNVLVSKDDEAFKNPTKPIGSFMTFEEASKLKYPTKEDAGRGYRRVVASPKPLKIIEEKQIESLIKDKNIVICCGGGGIPVIMEDNRLKGVDAVIDKDLASAKLAKDLNADILLILTAVDYAKINFNQPNEVELHDVTVDEIKNHLANNEFKSGSMKPKVEACLNFLENKNQKAIITTIENALEAINLKKGTIISL